MFSVLMSVYAGESPVFLRDCLLSISGQTIKSNDIVIVKDGTLPSELDQIITDFGSANEFVNIIEILENKGLGNSLKIGLEACRNNLVIRCDSDDINQPEKFRILYYLMSCSDSNVAVLGTSVKEFEEYGMFLNQRFFPQSVRTYSYLMRDPVAHPSIILKKDAILSVGGYKHCLYFEDTYLWLRLLSAGYLIHNLPTALTSMRVGDGFFARRSGLNYAKLEFKSFIKFYSEDLIGIYGLSIGICRSIFRLLPTLFVKKIYLRIFR